MTKTTKKIGEAFLRAWPSYAHDPDDEEECKQQLCFLVEVLDDAGIKVNLIDMMSLCGLDPEMD